MAYRPVLHWLDTLPLPVIAGPLHILDVGCGYGDGLRRIERWAGERGLPVELTGLDLNPDAAAIAAEASNAECKINWVAADVFSYTPERPVHVAVSFSVRPVFSRSRCNSILAMDGAARRDGMVYQRSLPLHVPCYFFRAFSKLAGLHPFVQYDGPISIARSFVSHDWQRMCAAAGLNARDVVIKGFKPARLCVGRRKTQ